MIPSLRQEQPTSASDMGTKDHCSVTNNLLRSRKKAPSCRMLCGAWALAVNQPKRETSPRPVRFPASRVVYDIPVGRIYDQYS